MSAWIVPKAHIDALVQEMVAREMISPGQATATGRMLWEENRLSVAYRYPNDASGERPGPIDLTDEAMAEYVFEGVEAPLHPEAIAYACGCFDYQSCEHPGWNSSHAKALTDQLEALCKAEPGVRDHPPFGTWPWGINDINDVIDKSRMGATS